MFLFSFKCLSDWDFFSDFSKMADKREKAALRAKEWRLRQKSTAEGRQQQQEYERTKYARKKMESHIKIKDLHPERAAKLRAKWRESKSIQRSKLRELRVSLVKVTIVPMRRNYEFCYSYHCQHH